MGYAETYDNYQNPAYRNRAEICIKEQGLIFVNDGRPDIASLGRAVVSGNWVDIDAIMSAVSCGPNGETAVTEDAALLSAVQSVWPVVADARYGHMTSTQVQVKSSPQYVDPNGTTNG